MSYRRIGEALGIAPSTAFEAVQRALKEIVQEPAEEVRRLELERLDGMYEHVLGVLERQHVTVSQGRVVRLQNPDTGQEEPIPDDGPILAAVTTLLKIQERRAKYLGLDSPSRVDLSGGVKYEVVGVSSEDLQ
ncbi:hypothetical protein ACFWHF_14510 [Streptomyces griseoincarnatus]